MFDGDPYIWLLLLQDPASCEWPIIVRVKTIHGSGMTVLFVLQSRSVQYSKRLVMTYSSVAQALTAGRHLAENDKWSGDDAPRTN